MHRVGVTVKTVGARVRGRQRRAALVRWSQVTRNVALRPIASQSVCALWENNRPDRTLRGTNSLKMLTLLSAMYLVVRTASAQVRRLSLTTEAYDMHREWFAVKTIGLHKMCIYVFIPRVHSLEGLILRLGGCSVWPLVVCKWMVDAIE